MVFKRHIKLGLNIDAAGTYLNGTRDNPVLFNTMDVQLSFGPDFHGAGRFEIDFFNSVIPCCVNNIPSATWLAVARQSGQSPVEEPGPTLPWNPIAPFLCCCR